MLYVTEPGTRICCFGPHLQRGTNHTGPGRVPLPLPRGVDVQHDPPGRAPEGLQGDGATGALSRPRETRRGLPGLVPYWGRVEGCGVPSATRNTQLVLLEYLQEAESATQWASLPTALTSCLPGHAAARHHHPNFNLRASKSLVRAF